MESTASSDLNQNQDHNQDGLDNLGRHQSVDHPINLLDSPVKESSNIGDQASLVEPYPTKSCPVQDRNQNRLVAPSWHQSIDHPSNLLDSPVNESSNIGDQARPVESYPIQSCPVQDRNQNCLVAPSWQQSVDHQSKSLDSPVKESSNIGDQSSPVEPYPIDTGHFFHTSLTQGIL